MDIKNVLVKTFKRTKNERLIEDDIKITLIQEGYRSVIYSNKYIREICRIAEKLGYGKYIPSNKLFVLNLNNDEIQIEMEKIKVENNVG